MTSDKNGLNDVGRLLSASDALASEMGLNEPSGHTKPLGHGWHDVLPSNAENAPSGQTAHDIAPDCVLYVPGTHPSHVLRPPSENEPGAHCVAIAAKHECPTGHATPTCMPDAGQSLPGGHNCPADEPAGHTRLRGQDDVAAVRPVEAQKKPAARLNRKRPVQRPPARCPTSPLLCRHCLLAATPLRRT